MDSAAWETIAPAYAGPGTGTSDGAAGLVDVSLGARGGGGTLTEGRATDGPTTWKVLSEACRYLEEGERATFRFFADSARLPLSHGEGGGSSAFSSFCRLGETVSPGDAMELDLRLEHLQRQLVWIAGRPAVDHAK